MINFSGFILKINTSVISGGKFESHYKTYNYNISTWWESVNELIAWPLTECVLMVRPWINIVAETPNSLAADWSSSLPMTSTSKASSPTLEKQKDWMYK